MAAKISKQEREELTEVFRHPPRRPIPIPTGRRAKADPLRGVQAVLFDVYGTLFASGAGDIGTAFHLGKPNAIISAMEACGIHVNGKRETVGEAGMGLYYQAIALEHEAARKKGVNQPEADILQVWRRVIRRLGSEGAITYQRCDEKILRRVACEYENRANPVWLMPGAAEMLETLGKAGVPLGVLSNAQFYTRHIFDALLGGCPEEIGFAPDLVFFSCEQGMAKPDAALYAAADTALRRRKITGRHVLMVGNDANNDVVPARAPGFLTCLFAGDKHSLRLADGPASVTQPDREIIRLNQLPGMILGKGVQRKG